MLFMIILHMIICLLLIGVVLIQRGRGSGLVESFAGVESMFGTKTSEFLTRTTTVLSTSFFISCLILTALSVKQSKSLMRQTRPFAPIEKEAVINKFLEQPKGPVKTPVESPVANAVELPKTEQKTTKTQ